MPKMKEIEATGEEFNHFSCKEMAIFYVFFIIWDFLYIFDISRKHPSRLRPPKLNHWELRGGWAHFGKGKYRPTTYVKIRENSNFDPRPHPSYRLNRVSIWFGEKIKNKIKSARAHHFCSDQRTGNKELFLSGLKIGGSNIYRSGNGLSHYI